MFELNYVIAPLLGGVIGYITNDIAIRMLFRPHTPKYIFGMHIPFTPGIIPKEKGRIAEAIGGVISENLMNKEVLERYLLSSHMISKLRSSVEDFFNTQKKNEESIEDFLSHYLSKEEIQSIFSNASVNFSNQVSKKLTDPVIGNRVAGLAMDYVSNKLNGEGPQVLLAGIGGAIGGLGGLAGGLITGPIISKFLSILREPAEKLLASNINDMLRNDGQKIVSNMVDSELNNMLNKKVCVLLAGHDDQLHQVEDTIESLYCTIIREHLPKILDSIDISQIVRERINEMEVNETEELIFQVMDKELKAIVWLGAGLGMIMGSINCFLF